MSKTQSQTQPQSKNQQQSFWQRFFLDMWYRKRWWAWLLLPVSWLYQILSFIYARLQKKLASGVDVPVVIIGNVSVGGTGKTPVIIALAKALQAQGLRVGIVSRGYNSQAPHYPYDINTETDSAQIVGDEPLLIAKTTHCPVVIGSDRVAAALLLGKTYPDVNLILSDDGLQHYRLKRDMEVVVVDGARGLGNHFCLPAGPLREPAKRLATVNWILLNQEQAAVDQRQAGNQLATVTITPVAWRHISTNQTYPLQPVPWQESAEKPVAIAGTGNPQRFFNTLAGVDLWCEEYTFDDHYHYQQEDFSTWQDRVVLMTEKDAVKCQTIKHEQLWSLIVDMTLPETFVESIVQLAAKK